MLGNVITEYVYELLENEAGLKKVNLDDSSFIFVRNINTWQLGQSDQQSGDAALDNSEHLALRARCPRGSRNFIENFKANDPIDQTFIFSKTPPPGSNKQTKKERQRRLLWWPPS